MASTYAALALLAGPPQVLFPTGGATLTGGTLVIALQVRSTHASRTVPCAEVLSAGSLAVLDAQACALSAAPLQLTVTLGLAATVTSGSVISLAAYVPYSDANTNQFGGLCTVA
jgi:hypothetical protein